MRDGTMIINNDGNSNLGTKNILNGDSETVRIVVNDAREHITHLRLPPITDEDLKQIAVKTVGDLLAIRTKFGFDGTSTTKEIRMLMYMACVMNRSRLTTLYVKNLHETGEYR